MSLHPHLLAYEQLRADLADALARADALGLIDASIKIDQAYLSVDDVIAERGGKRIGLFPIDLQHYDSSDWSISVTEMAELQHD